MPQSVAAPLAAIRRKTLEKVRNRVESQLATKSVFDDLRDGSAPELVPKLEIVASRLP